MVEGLGFIGSRYPRVSERIPTTLTPCDLLGLRVYGPVDVP